METECVLVHVGAEAGLLLAATAALYAAPAVIGRGRGRGGSFLGALFRENLEKNRSIPFSIFAGKVAGLLLETGGVEVDLAPRLRAPWRCVRLAVHLGTVGVLVLAFSVVVLSFLLRGGLLCMIGRREVCCC